MKDSRAVVRQDELPRFVRDLLATPPHRGQGLNNWFFRTARVLHAYRSKQEIVELLYAATYGEPLQPGEIERAVERSRAAAWKPGEAPAPRVSLSPQWPPVDHKKRAAIVVETGIALYDLWELSPVRFDDDLSHTEEVIDVLFPTTRSCAAA